MPVAIGDVVDGKYRIEKKLGAGAMGMVYAAQHLQLEERVALKFLSPALRASAEAKARFQREAKATFSLRSEHVARVLDVGKLPSETPFIVMEFLDGKTLREHVSTHGLPNVAEAISFMLEACEGVAEAHTRGIVHRDLKPENLFVTKTGDGRPLIKVLDFGISKELLGPTGDSITGSDVLVGTPRYMAPEQFGRSSDVDARTDVWALGVILHYLLTGVTPFDAPSQVGIMNAILAGAPRAPSHSNPRVTAAIDEIVLRCLSRKKEGRFDSAGALRLALVQLDEPATPAPAPRDPIAEPDTIPGKKRVAGEKTASEKSAADDDTLAQKGLATDIDETTRRMKRTSSRPPRAMTSDEQSLPSIILSEEARADSGRGDPTVVVRRASFAPAANAGQTKDERSDLPGALVLGLLIAAAVIVITMKACGAF
jgi:serine/threonine-protein kinase